MVQSNDKEVEEIVQQRMIVADRDLQTMPEDLPLYLGLEPCDVSRLTHLTICRTQLTAVPASLSLLAGLCSLELVDNKLTDLPDELGRLHVKRLVVSGNKLDKMPACFFMGLDEVRELDLSRNEIFDLLTPPLCAAKLRSLDFSGNHVLELPEWLSTSCGALATLAAAENPALTGGRLRGPLHALDVSSCAVNSLDFLRGLRSLVQLRAGNDPGARFIGGNCFWDFPDILLQQADTLSVLSLRGTSLSQLPPGIGLLRSLTELDLRDCQLHTLPKEMGELASLRSLLLSGNRLVALPDTVVNLGSLRDLLLDGNLLELLPAGLAGLTGLEHLDLYNNSLDEWQASLLDALPALRGIDVERNLCALENTERYERLRQCLRLRLDATHRLDGCKEEEEPSLEDDESEGSYCSQGEWAGHSFEEDEEAWQRPSAPREAESDWGDNESASDDEWAPPEKWAVACVQRVAVVWPPLFLTQKTFVRQDCVVAEGQFSPLLPELGLS